MEKKSTEGLEDEDENVSQKGKWKPRRWKRIKRREHWGRSGTSNTQSTGVPSGKGGRREPEGCSGKEAPRRGLAGDAGCVGMRGDRDAVAERAVSL